MGKRSNDKRAERRMECREMLSNHIYEKLKIRVRPVEVRLQPGPRERYAWSYPPTKSHLFQSSLSRGNLSTFEEICEELDRSIEAVPRGADPNAHDLDAAEAARSSTPSDWEPRGGADDSFTAQIRRLNQEKSHLEEEVQATRHELQQGKQHTEELARSLQQANRRGLQWKSAAERYCAEIERMAGALTGLMEGVQAAQPHRASLETIRNDCETADRSVSLSRTSEFPTDVGDER